MIRSLSPSSQSTDSGEPAPGRIFTFYSYKGGTGRSMSLANVAWILAMNGRRVLVIDWDFEAPGLHRYYWPFLPDPEMTETPGLIDFFVHFGEAARLEARRPTETNSEGDPWFYDRTDLMRYSVPLDYEFPDGGVLDFIGAGQQGPTYGVRVNTFQWGSFYKEMGGGVFLEAVKSRLREDYDFVLIDSRTGLSDTSGICTVHMPDELVVCFTLNRQSTLGAAATAASADTQRRLPTGEQSIRVWPVPMRIELAEKERLEAGRLFAREKFAPFLWHIPPAMRPEYWGSVEVLYFPYYAYEEILATVADTPKSSASLLNSLERLTGHLTGGVISAMPIVNATARSELLARYRRKPPGMATPPKGSPRIFISYSKLDDSLPIVRKLAREITERFGENSVFWDEKVPLGAKWSEALPRALEKAETILIVAGPEWKFSLGSQAEMTQAVRSNKALIPLLTGGALWSDLPDTLKERRGFVLGSDTLDEDIRSFVTQMAVNIPESQSVERAVPVEIDDPQKGQWGGQSERDGRRLTARVTDGSPGSEDWFNVVLEVEGTEGKPLEGEVEFHLHPSFHPAIVSVPVENGRASLEHRAWGAFTLGACADGGRTRLELDLATLSDAPEIFRQR